MSNRTAAANVTTGQIRVEPGPEDTDILHHEGRILGLTSEVEPWGAEETGMERADAELAAMGWRRVGAWSNPYGETWTAAVQPGTEAPTAGEWVIELYNGAAPGVEGVELGLWDGTLPDAVWAWLAEQGYDVDNSDLWANVVPAGTPAPNNHPVAEMSFSA